MKILVTGASGYVGNKLTNTLASLGNEVHALVRSDAARDILQHPNIKIVKGDILDKENLLAAMRNCDQVYHTAAKVGAWTKSPSAFFDVNVQGTRNVMEAALQTGVNKLVYTSTCGVLGPSDTEPLTENAHRTTPFIMAYDRSKKMAEDIFFEYSRRGLNAVAICPPKIYGPGKVSHSLTGTALIDRFIKKGIALVPAPGDYIVCFAFIDDVVNGHLLAMQHGKRNAKYIIGGVNISYKEFFARIRTLSSTRGRIIPVPRGIIKAFAHVQMLKYNLTGSAPLFTPRDVDYVFNNYAFSSEKAIHELGYAITPLDEALNKTIQYIKTLKRTS